MRIDLGPGRQMTKIPHLAVIFGTGIRISFGIKGVGSSSSRFSKLKKKPIFCTHVCPSHNGGLERKTFTKGHSLKFGNLIVLPASVAHPFILDVCFVPLSSLPYPYFNHFTHLFSGQRVKCAIHRGDNAKNRNINTNKSKNC